MKTFHLGMLALAAIFPLIPACKSTASHSGLPTNHVIISPTADGARALIKLQHPDGAFGNQAKNSTAITALAGLAMLSCEASMEDSSPSMMSPAVRRAADFLLGQQDQDGYIALEGDSAGMYGHAFATLFLTQLYANMGDQAYKAKLGAAIRKAVTLIEVTQNPQGGWRYLPKPLDADVSVSAGELKALVAAKDVGFKVSDDVLKRGVAYLKSAQQPDGGFNYMVGSGSASGWARTAAATAALLYAGAGGGQDTGKALAYLRQPNNTPNAQAHFFYGNYYLAQALNLGDLKTNSTSSFRSVLLARQDPRTHLWNGDTGPAYATAMALITLYMPTSTLPAFRPLTGHAL